jgi:hypothetical protein
MILTSVVLNKTNNMEITAFTPYPLVPPDYDGQRTTLMQYIHPDGRIMTRVAGTYDQVRREFIDVRGNRLHVPSHIDSMLIPFNEQYSYEFQPKKYKLYFNHVECPLVSIVRAHKQIHYHQLYDHPTPPQKHHAAKPWTALHSKK